MIFKIKKTIETETEVNIETPAYFTDNYSCETIYKVCESCKIIGITVFDNHVNFLEYSNVDFDKLYTSTKAEFEQAKEKLIKYLESL
jgi:predicted transcriptional regulator